LGQADFLYKERFGCFIGDGAGEANFPFYRHAEPKMRAGIFTNQAAGKP
jgi:hypothetical protein